MTDREKAIVMAYTGIVMLNGEKWYIYHEYVEEIMGRPVQTLEMMLEKVSNEIKEKSRADFISLCDEEQEKSVTPQPKMGRWIMSDDGLYRPICNNCGAHPWKGYIPTVEEATDVFKYCPNCGAKMQEVEG